MITTNCPICDAHLTLPDDTEESEIVSCTDCHTKLVVAKKDAATATLAEAPAVEEDWGE